MAWHHWCQCERCEGYRPIDGVVLRERREAGDCPPEMLGENPPGKLCTCPEALRPKAAAPTSGLAS